MRVFTCLAFVALALTVHGCSFPESRDAVRQRLRDDLRAITQELLVPVAEAAARAAVEEALRKAPDLSGVRPGKGGDDGE